MISYDKIVTLVGELKNEKNKKFQLKKLKLK